MSYFFPSLGSGDYSCMSVMSSSYDNDTRSSGIIVITFESFVLLQCKTTCC